MELTQLQQIITPLILAFMMFGMGLTLSFADFKRIAQQPFAIGMGLLLQMTFLPLLGFALARV